MKRKKLLFAVGAVCVGILCALALAEAGLRLYKSSLAQQNLRPLALAGNARIVLSLGESTTYGFLSAPDANYSRLLEKRLNAAAPQAGYRVLNLGYPAAISDDIAALLKEALAVYRPVAVLACLGDNDMGFPVNYRLRRVDSPARHPFSLDPKGPGPGPARGLLLWKILKTRLAGREFDWFAQETDLGRHWTMVLDREGNRRYYYYNMGPNARGKAVGWSEQEKAALLANLEKNILAMNEACREKNVPFLLVGYMASGINDYLEKWSADNKILYVDNKVADPAAYARLVVKKDMFHPNAAGHALMCENILGKLVPQLPGGPQAHGHDGLLGVDAQ